MKIDTNETTFLAHEGEAWVFAVHRLDNGNATVLLDKEVEGCGNCSKSGLRSVILPNDVLQQLHDWYFPEQREVQGGAVKDIVEYLKNFDRPVALRDIVSALLGRHSAVSLSMALNRRTDLFVKVRRGVYTLAENVKG